MNQQTLMVYFLTIRAFTFIPFLLVYTAEIAANWNTIGTNSIFAGVGFIAHLHLQKKFFARFTLENSGLSDSGLPCRGGGGDNVGKQTGGQNTKTTL
jgi:hypothetical protein